MKKISILPITGPFAENKDLSRELRVNKIIPYLKENKKIDIDFNGVENTTQSFIHALLSEAIRYKGENFADYVSFSNCNDKIMTIIEIVYQYTMDNLDEFQVD
jgi:hypothetical protein